MFMLFLLQVNLKKSDVNLNLDVLEQAGEMAIAEQQTSNERTDTSPLAAASAASITPTCRKCSPVGASPLRPTLDQSFPCADLDLASSTDSCSSSEESDKESGSGSERDDDEVESMTKDVKNLSVIAETDEASSSGSAQDKSLTNVDTLAADVQGKLSLDKNKDSSTLNF